MVSPDLLVFPCDYPVKVFLKPDPAVEDRLVEVVRSQLPGSSDLTVGRHFSRAGRYLCLTFRFTAQSADEARRVGAALRDEPGVILSL
jgi:hypothetical protein